MPKHPEPKFVSPGHDPTTEEYEIQGASWRNCLIMLGFILALACGSIWFFTATRTVANPIPTVAQIPSDTLTARASITLSPGQTLPTLIPVLPTKTLGTFGAITATTGIRRSPTPTQRRIVTSTRRATARPAARSNSGSSGSGSINRSAPQSTARRQIPPLVSNNDPVIRPKPQP